MQTQIIEEIFQADLKEVADGSGICPVFKWHFFKAPPDVIVDQLLLISQ